MPKSKKGRRIGDYPEHLRGLGTNRHGGNQLQRERGLKGGTYGPAGPGRTFSKEEREAFQNERPAIESATKGIEKSNKARSRPTLEAQFQDHVLKLLEEAVERTGDELGSIVNLIKDLGAVEVARMLVDPTKVRKPSRGFLVLMKNNLARLTIEQAIVDFANTELFSPEEVETARARLSIFSKGRQRGGKTGERQ